MPLARSDLKERDDRAPALDVMPDEIRRAVQGEGLPAVPLDRVDESRRGDAFLPDIHERGEIGRRHLARSPEALHHGD